MLNLWNFLFMLSLNVLQIFLSLVNFEFEILRFFNLVWLLFFFLRIFCSWLWMKINCIFIKTLLFLFTIILLIWSVIVNNCWGIRNLMVFRSFFNFRNSCNSWSVRMWNKYLTFWLVTFIWIKLVCNYLRIKLFMLRDCWFKIVMTEITWSKIWSFSVSQLRLLVSISCIDRIKLLIFSLWKLRILLIKCTALYLL